MEPAVRVAAMLMSRREQGGGGRCLEGCEMWKDWPAAADTSGDKGGDGEVVEVGGGSSYGKGRGKWKVGGRCWLAGVRDGGKMMGKE